jgi:hypothetical protein
MPSRLLASNPKKDTGASTCIEESKLDDDVPEEEDDSQRRRKRPKKGVDQGECGCNRLLSSSPSYCHCSCL